MDSHDEDASRGGGFDPMQLWRMFVRRKWLFIVPFFLCLGMAAVAIKTQEPIYYSSVQLQVIRQASTARSLPQEAPRYDRRNNPDNESFVMIRTIVTSPRFLRKLVTDLNLHRRAIATGEVPPAPPGVSAERWEERAVGMVAARIAGQVRIRNDSESLFSIGMRDTDPDRAFLLTKKILEDFLAEERASRMAPSSATRDFLEGQRQVIAGQLAEAQNRLSEFERTRLNETLAGNPITAENLSLAEGVLGRLRSQTFDVGSTELMNLERLARDAADPLPALGDLTANPNIAAAARELASLEYDAAISEVLGRQGAGAADQSSTLGLARLNLNNLVEAAVATRYPGLGVAARTHLSQYGFALVDRDVAQRVVTRLDTNIREFRGFVARQPQQSAQLASLQQEVTRLQEQLQGLERDIAAENLRLAANMSELGYRWEVRQDPQRPYAPIEPNKVRLAFMGFALALAMGVGLVILAEFLDRSFKSLSDIERSLGVKVIGTLPMIETRLFGARTRRRSPWVWVILVAAILVVAAAGFLFIYPRLS